MARPASQVVSSNCDDNVKFSLKSAEKLTKSSPCSNRPVICSLCKTKTVNWSYDVLTYEGEAW